MSTFYTVVTVWADTPTTTADFTNIEKALAEYDFRIALAKVSQGAITGVRVLRISTSRTLDITPGLDY